MNAVQAAVELPLRVDLPQDPRAAPQPEVHNGVAVSSFAVEAARRQVCGAYVDCRINLKTYLIRTCSLGIKFTTCTAFQVIRCL